MSASTGAPSTRDMAWIPGGPFRMGSDEHYPEERPVHDVAVDGFWMDEHQVTVAEFRRFVKATGHVTVAERRARRRPTIPDADPELLVPGSLVFRQTARSRRPRRLPELVALGAGRRSGAIPRARAATSRAATATP